MKVTKQQKIGLTVLAALMLLGYMFRKKITTAVNTLSEYLYNTLKDYESIKKDNTGNYAVAYWDNLGGVWTIGWGNTYYADGSKIKQNDKLTIQEADTLFKFWVNKFADQVKEVVKQPINENQFNALVLWAYNVGPAFKTSTLIKKLNIDPNDPSIREEFLKWNKAGGQFVQGLYNRRKKEADLYFTPI